MSIVTYLKQPYPFYYKELVKVFFVLCCVAVTSFLFTYLFEPFIVNPSEHKIDNLWIIVLHSLIPVPITMVYVFFLRKGVRDIEKWTLGKDFFHLAIILLLVSLGNFLVRDLIYTNTDNVSFRYLWEEIRNTFLVGSLLLVIILPLNLERLIYRHLKGLKKLPIQKEDLREENTILRIKTPIREEVFELNINSFLYAKIDSNYLEIFYENHNGTQKRLTRLTLKEFEEQLGSFPFVCKVHRSYIVNLKAVASISGNAQGYVLRLKNVTQETIPVSRSKIQEFNALYSNMAKA